MNTLASLRGARFEFEERGAMKEFMPDAETKLAECEKETAKVEEDGKKQALSGTF